MRFITDMCVYACVFLFRRRVGSLIIYAAPGPGTHSLLITSIVGHASHPSLSIWGCAQRSTINASTHARHACTRARARTHARNAHFPPACHTPEIYPTRVSNSRSACKSAHMCWPSVFYIQLSERGELAKAAVLGCVSACRRRHTHAQNATATHHRTGGRDE